MERGWGRWSPLAGELARLPNAYAIYTAEQQTAERPLDYLPELDLLRECAARQAGPVLDLGCGTGRHSLALARAGFQVVGVDLQPAFIEAARAAADSLPPEARKRVRFEVGDARSLSLPERFGLVAMLDQAFKYLLTHEDHLACLSRVREHLRDDGRFLVEHRCFFRLPTAADETPYEFRWREGDWVGVDTYDPVQQVHLSAYQPADDPEGPTLVEPIRDFTWQELSLLHHVSGFVLEEVWHDLDERAEPVDYFDGAFLWTKRQA